MNPAVRRLRRTRLAELPPLLTGVVAVAFAVATTTPAEPTMFWVGTVGVVASASSVLLPQTHHGRGLLEAAPQAFAILSYALIAAATGGASSEFAALLLLPLLWFGLEGNQPQLVGGLLTFALGLTLTWLLASGGATATQLEHAAVLAGAGLAIVFGPRIVSEAQRHRSARYKSLADHDGLTSLLNRRAFIDLAEAELARAQRHAQDLALVSLDLDGFKQLNDTQGHPAGDRALVTVAEGFASTLRSHDLLARPGGDEFMALLVQTPRSAAPGVAERLRATVSPPLSCSAGLAFPRADESLADLIARADAALYEAKGRGRSCLVVAPA